MQQGGILPFILFNGGLRKAIVPEEISRELLRLQVSKGKTCIWRKSSQWKRTDLARTCYISENSDQLGLQIISIADL